MKRAFVLFVCFYSFLLFSQSQNLRPAGKTSLQKAIYCYAYVGTETDWQDERYLKTVDDLDFKKPFDILSAGDILVLVTRPDGEFYLVYWDQNKKTSNTGMLAFQTTNEQPCLSGASIKNGAECKLLRDKKSCAKILTVNYKDQAINLVYQSGKAQFARVSFLNDDDMRDCFVGNPEKYTLKEIVPKHSGSMIPMLRNRAKNMLDKKVLHEPLKSKIECYCRDKLGSCYRSL